MTAVTAEAVRDHVLRQVEQPLASRGLAPMDVPEDFDLLAEGVVDSFGLLEIINQVESHFRISVDFENLEAEDITVIGPFSRYVAANAEQTAPAPAASDARPEPAPAPAAVTLPPRTATAPRRVAGRLTVGMYRFYRRALAKGFSLAGAGAFASFGANSVLQPPVRLSGERRMAVGRGVYVGAGSWLQVLDGYGDGVAIELGDYVSIAGNCVLSAVSSVKLGRSVSLAPNVYIADHTHAYRDSTRAVADQGITDIAAVEICDGAWLGTNVVVLPGVRVGEHAVVAANSVVTSDVPDHALAAGAPARVVSRFG